MLSRIGNIACTPLARTAFVVCSAIHSHLLQAHVRCTATTTSTSTGANRVELDVADLTFRDTYSILCSSVVPRPIALISTVSGVCGLSPFAASTVQQHLHDMHLLLPPATGVHNIAPLSFFMPVTASPMTIAFSLTRCVGSVHPSCCLPLSRSPPRFLCHPLSSKKHGKVKDTLVNILATRQFVINHVCRSFFQQAYTGS